MYARRNAMPRRKKNHFRKCFVISFFVSLYKTAKKKDKQNV